MADIVKKVNQWIPPTERTQSFTQDDAGTGDVILVKESLGRSARKVFIDATDAVQVRFNVYHTVFPQRRHQTDFMYTEQLPLLVSGVQVKDSTMAAIWVDDGTTFEMDGDFPTNDIELVVASGVFNILVS